MTSTLDVATTFFTLKYQDILPKMVNLSRCKDLMSETTLLPSEFSKREHSARESGYGMLVRKQQQLGRPHKICAILEKEKTNPLGMKDFYYFYIIYRDKVQHSWADALGLKKYNGKPGIYLPFSILKHIENNQVKYHSEIVLMLHTEGVPNRLLRIKSYDAFKYFTSNKLPLLINSYGVRMTALPLEIMTEELEDEK